MRQPERLHSLIGKNIIPGVGLRSAQGFELGSLLARIGHVRDLRFRFGLPMATSERLRQIGSPEHLQQGMCEAHYLITSSDSPAASRCAPPRLRNKTLRKMRVMIRTWLSATPFLERHEVESAGATSPGCR